MTDEPAPTLLTQRERQVLLLLINGTTNRALARQLGIAERTLRAHLTSISRKLCLSSRVEAALYAYRHRESLLAMQPGDDTDVSDAVYHREIERAIA
ncbi:LuxR C-terminal-related transcriptional regulator [Streptomyces flavidovirens]|uniref:response regulator transcription factor n=1 Tax=Streptomyces flavidovirens TaxID=67298 RepID=UPI00342C76E4